MAYNSSTNSIFYINATGGLGRLNAATGVNTAVTGIAGVTYRTLATRDGIVSFLGTTAANEASYLAINATSLAIQDTVNLVNFVLPSSRMGKAVLIPGVSSAYIFRYSFVDSFSSLRIAQGILTPTGFISFHTHVALAGFGTTVMPSLVPGHTGYFVVGQDSTTSTNLRMDGYSTMGALLHQTQTPGYTFASSNFGADNIVAPEPGTMIAIGVGLAAMLKRRKKTS